MKMIMKRAIFLFVLTVFSLYLSLFANATTGSSLSPPEGGFFDNDIEISMDFKDASIIDVMKAFSIQSGLNFIASESVQDRKLTLYLDKVPLKNAMDKLFEANNLYYELDREANIFIVKDMGKPDKELVTKVFFLKYASVTNSSLLKELGSNLGGSDTSLTAVVKQVLSPLGSVIEDGRTNSLIVRDAAIRIPIISETIAALDVPQPQILIEVEMLDVSKDLLDNIGFKFGDSPLDMVIKGSLFNTTWPVSLLGLSKKNLNNSSSTSSTSTTTSSGSLDFSAPYEIIFNFIKQRADTKILARPRILTLNNQTAEVKITTKETIVSNQSNTSSGGSNVQTSETQERVDTGVTLRVTPQVNLETGDITMFIMPTVKDTSKSSLTTTIGGIIKDPEERSTKSIVRVKDGETVMLGGLIRRSLSQTITKLPFLGDIPFIGALFTNKTKDKDVDRELLVFITPRIIQDEAFKFAQMRKYRIPEREQELSSTGNRVREISSTLDKYEKFDP